MNATATIPNGSTAAELRELVEAHPARKSDVIAYLESRPKLRKPSATLLAELTGRDVQPTKRKPRDTTPNPKPEHAAGPVNHFDPQSLENSTLYSAKTGRKLSGKAKAIVWHRMAHEAAQTPAPVTTARDKATGGAKPDPKPSSQRNRIDVLVNLGEAIAELGREYKAICDAERH